MSRKHSGGHGESTRSAESLYRSNVQHKKVEKHESPYGDTHADSKAHHGSKHSMMKGVKSIDPKLSKTGESKHLKHIVPDLSQGGLTGVRFISHEVQSAGHLFQPYPFNRGLENRLYGGVEHQITHTLGDPHRVRMNSENLQKMVQSTVGNAYNLANVSNTYKDKGHAHKDNTVKGSLLGRSATQPERYGQVPYAGRFY